MGQLNLFGVRGRSRGWQSFGRWLSRRQATPAELAGTWPTHLNGVVAEPVSRGGSKGDEVTDQSPLVDKMDRLARLLQAYERDEVWLHVKQFHPLSCQHAQVVVAVEDAAGAVLHESSGWVRSHTFRLDPSLEAVDVGHRFHVARDGAGVRVASAPAYANFH